MSNWFDGAMLTLTALVAAPVLLLGQEPKGPPQRKTLASPPSAERPLTASPSVLSPPPVFRDIAADAGLTVSHISSPDKKYILESMSGGGGLLGWGNDGRVGNRK